MWISHNFSNKKGNIMKSEKRKGHVKKTKWLAEIGGLSYTVENQVIKEVEVIVQI